MSDWRRCWWDSNVWVGGECGQTFQPNVVVQPDVIWRSKWKVSWFTCHPSVADHNQREDQTSRTPLSTVARTSREIVPVSPFTMAVLSWWKNTHIQLDSQSYLLCVIRSLKDQRYFQSFKNNIISIVAHFCKHIHSKYIQQVAAMSSYFCWIFRA